MEPVSYGAVALVPPKAPSRRTPALLFGCFAFVGVFVGTRRADVRPSLAADAYAPEAEAAIAHAPVQPPENVCALVSDIISTCAADVTGSPVLAGTDVVSYHTGDQPLVGVAAYDANYHDNLLYFATEANRDTFVADPEAYMPRGGGFCALALSGMDVDLNDCVGVSPVQPGAFRIVEGLLWVFRSESAAISMEKLRAEAALVDPGSTLIYDMARVNWQKLTGGDIFAGGFNNKNGDECMAMYGDAQPAAPTPGRPGGPATGRTIAE